MTICENKKRQVLIIRSLSNLNSDLQDLQILEKQQSLIIIEKLNSALEKLNLEDSKIVRAVYLEREPRAAVAKRLGISYKALESKLVRLRKKLKDMILEDSRNE